MNRSIALAYGITGLAVAAALVAIIGATTGLFAGDAPAPTADAPLSAPSPTAAPSGPSNVAAGQPVADEALAPANPEIVYVDEPAPGRARHHDDDDDDDDDRSARGSHHRDHGDDDHD